QTRRSAIAALGSSDAAVRAMAYEKIITAYWQPAYKHLRLRWKASNDDAKDLVQGFFTCALDKTFFRDFEPDKGTFRTYLDRFVSKESQSARALKRGGGIMPASLDFHGAEMELAYSTPAVEDCFQKEWVRSLFELAIAALRRQCESQASWY